MDSKAAAYFAATRWLALVIDGIQKEVMPLVRVQLPPREIVLFKNDPPEETHYVADRVLLPRESVRRELAEAVEKWDQADKAWTLSPSSPHKRKIRRLMIGANFENARSMFQAARNSGLGAAILAEVNLLHDSLPDGLHRPSQTPLKRKPGRRGRIKKILNDRRDSINEAIVDLSDAITNGDRNAARDAETRFNNLASGPAVAKALGQKTPIKARDSEEFSKLQDRFKKAKEGAYAA